MALRDEVFAAIERFEHNPGAPHAAEHLQVAQIKALVLIAQTIEQSAAD